MRIPDINFQAAQPNIIQDSTSGALAAPQQVAQQGAQQLSNIAISSQEQERNKSVSMQLNAINSKYQAELVKSSAMFTDARGELTVNTTLNNAISDVASTLGRAYNNYQAAEAQQKEKDLQALNKTYMLEASTKFDENIIYKSEALKTKIGGDASAYTPALMELYNQEIAKLVKEAPSAEAQEKLFYSLEGKRIKALEESMGFTAQRRQELVSMQVKNSVDNIIKTAVLNPTKALEFTNSLEEVRGTLSEMGAPQEMIDKTLKTANDQLLTIHVDNQLTNGGAQQVKEGFINGSFDSLDDMKFKELYNKTAKRIEFEHKEAEKIAIKDIHINRVNSGVPLTDSTDDKEAFNTVYSTLTEQLRDPNTGVLRYNDRNTIPIIGEVINKNNTYIAPQLAKELEASLKSDNPEANQFGAKVVSYLINDKNKRHLLNDIDTKTVMKADMLNTELSTGVSLEKATQIVNSKVNNYRSDLAESRRKEFTNIVKYTDVQDILTNEFETGFFNINALNSADATAQYMITAKSQYELTGDLEAAKKIALTKVSKEFGVSKINGEREIMRNAPEVLFRNQDMDEVYNQLNTGVYRALGIDVPEKGFFDSYTPLPAKDSNGNDIQIKLQSDYATSLKGNTEGSYAILISTKGGEFVPMMDDLGQQLRTQFTGGLNNEQLETLQNDLTKRNNYDIMKKQNNSDLKAFKESMKERILRRTGEWFSNKNF
jgi:hypothetical protein